MTQLDVHTINHYRFEIGGQTPEREKLLSNILLLTEARQHLRTSARELIASLAREVRPVRGLGDSAVAGHHSIKFSSSWARRAVISRLHEAALIVALVPPSGSS